MRVDGSAGEGGGQILRTALAAALATGRELHLERVRAGRRRPGLRPQHLAAVRAAAAIGEAAVEGATIGSTRLTFVPGGLRPGRHRFSVGTAGSVGLVLQTVLPPLLAADRPSELVLEGGTHNPGAPPYDFLASAYLPLLARMGPDLEPRLDRHGFYPAGGGRMTVRVEPAGSLAPLTLLDRGTLKGLRGRALLARLPDHIGRRELATVRHELGWADLVVRRVESDGPGNVLLLEVEAEQVTEVFSGFGRRGLPAEEVARGVVAEARRYVEADVPVGSRLADQLLLPLALAGGGSFRTLPTTSHFQTNAHLLESLLDARIGAREEEDGSVTITVS